MPKTLHASVRPTYPKIVGWYSISGDLYRVADLFLQYGPDDFRWACYTSETIANPARFAPDQHARRCTACTHFAQQHNYA